MSWVKDVLASVKRVILLEDRVDRLTAAVDGLARELTDTRERVIRIEGLLEGAYRASTHRRDASAPPEQSSRRLQPPGGSEP